MRLSNRVLPVLFITAMAVATAAPRAARAQAPADTATVIIRLGTDTLAIERWVRTADRLESTYVGRSPRTTTRHYTLRFGRDGRVTHAATALAGATLEEQPVRQPGAVPVAGGLYAPYAVMLAEAARAGTTETTVSMQAGQSVRPTIVRRVGPGEYAMPSQFEAEMTARLDDAGRVLSIDAGGGTTVERVRGLDFDALAAEFAARDERGAGLGPLSPRETTEAHVHGAHITVEYGRPAARGRVVLGGLVPFDEVWRTGANQETLLTTDHTLDFDGLRVEPGAYSIFTIPGRAAWQLVVNRQTGQGGLGHDPAHDVGRALMRVRSLDLPVERFTIVVEPTPDGGVLRMRWDDTEAAAPFRVLH